MQIQAPPPPSDGHQDASAATSKPKQIRTQKDRYEVNHLLSDWLLNTRGAVSVINTAGQSKR